MDPNGNRSLKAIAKTVGDWLSSRSDAASRGTINSVKAARVRGIDDAWAMEIQMVQKTGAGTRKWDIKELELLEEGKRVPGYIGDHITTVSSDITKAADHRNIQFLTKAERRARHAEAGGTRVPISENRLIDRTLDGKLPDLASEGAKSWSSRAGEALKAIGNSRTLALIDAFDPTSIADKIMKEQYGTSFFEWSMMSWEQICASDPDCI